MSLFTSIRDIEAARMARIALEKSDLQLENFNVSMALLYLRVVGGKGYLSRIGLSRYEPKWLGKREDLMTLGGKKTRSEEAWTDYRYYVPMAVHRKVLDYVLKISVIVAMNTHLYKFYGCVYLQTIGGPIGKRFTACLAAVIMKLWDTAWLESMDNVGLSKGLYDRYVDDSRNMLRPLSLGWQLETGNGFVYKSCWREDDLSTNMCVQRRTTEELTQAMNDVVWFLSIMGEDHTMFKDSTLPTLDTAIERWTDQEQIL